MNRREKIVQKHFLNQEEDVIYALKSTYRQSLKDINKKVFELDTSITLLQKAYESVEGDEIGDLAAAFLKNAPNMTPDEARETLKSMLQSKVYQKKYQKALQKQVGDILADVHDNEYKTISKYLDNCYEDGFIGTMYNLQGQDIPLCFPLDQEAMVRAVQTDSKISNGLYSRLGEDVSMLKKRITAQISRGISTGMSYQQVAQQLAGETSIGFNNAVRIARTEGHRVQVQSSMDACYKAQESGADVVKQWDAALDRRTRESHARVDGEIRELDEKFSNGLMYPGDPNGRAAEVVNCRCALNQRAKWALDDDELQTLKERASYYGLDKADSFKEYKEKYLKAAKEISEEVLTESSKNSIIRLGIQYFASKEKQFGKKVGKHAMDYGLDPSKKEDREKFQKIISNITDNSEEVRIGFWRGQSEDVLFHILGEDVVITDQNNEFISILKGGINNARVKNARNK